MNKWYSSISVGILEIDNQHSNIDNLINLYKNDPYNEDSWLSNIERSMKEHFQYEEQYLDKGLSKAHKNEHKKLLFLTSKLVKDRKNNKITKDQFVKQMIDCLISHVIDFDIEIKDQL